VKSQTIELVEKKIPQIPKKKQVNYEMVNQWAERYDRNKKFELKMITFLAVLDHKNN
jgi:hypothetical protein